MDHRAADPGRPPADPAASPDPEGERLNFRVELDAFLALKRLEVPVIAAVRGPCVGAGFDLACHCDMAVIASDARFQVAYVKRGLFPDLGGFYSIPRKIGWPKAMELMTTGRFMDAQEAHAAGLSNYLVEPEHLEDRALRLARDVEAGPPIGVKIAKLLAVRTMHMDFDSALEWSATALPLVTLSQDRREGVASFLERREPRFDGR